VERLGRTSTSTRGNTVQMSRTDAHPDPPGKSNNERLPLPSSSFLSPPDPNAPPSTTTLAIGSCSCPLACPTVMARAARVPATCSSYPAGLVTVGWSDRTIFAEHPKCWQPSSGTPLSTPPMTVDRHDPGNLRGGLFPISTGAIPAMGLSGRKAALCLSINDDIPTRRHHEPVAA